MSDTDLEIFRDDEKNEPALTTAEEEAFQDAKFTKAENLLSNIKAGEQMRVKITNIKPVQVKPIPWGWKNKIMPDGTLWVSEHPGKIKMPWLVDYFDFRNFETEEIPELECNKPVLCSVNMKSVFTTACRFLGTEKAMIMLAMGELDLRPITESMLEWNTALLWFNRDKIERFILGDEIGMNTGMMISPEMYRKYILPEHKKIAGLIKYHGRDIWYHSDGDISAVLPDIKDAGFTGVYYEDCGCMKKNLKANKLEGIEVVR